MLTVNVCIACYKNDPFIKEAIESCKKQTYPNEVVVYHDDVGIGTGEAFNRAISQATADIIVLLCSDDIFTDEHVIEDIVKVFDTYPDCVHVSRWYHQFVDGDRHPVRAWRGDNVIELANNPSGLAFRRSSMLPLTNKMFVEASQPVWQLVYANFYSILKYDTVAVRIHKSISRTPGYYKKMWTSSPVEEWAKLGWKSHDYTHLIQVAVNFEKKAVWNEILNFIKVDKRNLFNPAFWFFSILSIVSPRVFLYRIPEIYRATWGRWTTKEVKRHE